MKNTLARLFFILSVSNISAQDHYNYLTAEIDGLTCSACMNSVVKRISLVKYVDSIYSDIQNTSCTIFIHGSECPDFKSIAKEVKNAGFALHSLCWRITLDSLLVCTNQSWPCMSIGGRQYHILNYPLIWQPEGYRFILMGRNYQNKKIFRQYKELVAKNKNVRCSLDADLLLQKR
ncbi:MAG: heavy metal-associated domain-containing protein [Saprospiraceae bacterium]